MNRYDLVAEAMQGRYNLQLDISRPRQGDHRYAEQAKEGKILPQGKPVDTLTIFAAFDERNAKYGNLSMTPYLPAIHL